MAEDEGDFALGAEIGDPIPGEDALHGDDQIGSVEWSDRLLEHFDSSIHVAVKHDVPQRVQHAEIHLLCMQVDSAVELVLRGVESHKGLLLLVGL
jgi:hypothetical protein